MAQSLCILKMPWFVYIIECSDKSLYTGSTNDISARFKRHKEGKGAKYTRSRGVKRLVYTQKFRNRSAALKKEAAIKRLTRSEKLMLIG